MTDFDHQTSSDFAKAISLLREAQQYLLTQFWVGGVEGRYEPMPEDAFTVQLHKRIDEFLANV